MIDRLRFWLGNFFGIPKSQANGFIILFPLCFVIIASPYLYDHFSFEAKATYYNKPVLDSLLAVMEANVILTKNEEINTGVKYKTDRSYSGDSRLYNKNEPDTKEEKPALTSRNWTKKKPYAVVPFDINEADTTVLKKVKGIGSVLSNRIIKYRDLLGGFVDVSQYKEVYGLQDSVVIALDTLALIGKQYKPETIPINTINEWKLARHPYVNKRQAKAIMNYKNQHGDFNSIEDLFNIKLLDSAMIYKLSPYLKY